MNKCAGGTHPSLEMMHTTQGLPPPESIAAYSTHATKICKMSILQARVSMQRARQEVWEFYDTDVKDADILISCDGTWQKRGFTSLSSLYGVCGKVCIFYMISVHIVFVSLLISTLISLFGCVVPSADYAIDFTFTFIHLWFLLAPWLTCISRFSGTFFDLPCLVYKVCTFAL
jgi:hypothetical protein